VRPTSLAAAVLALALAGCPIPQPLPDYPAGTVTPPRILTDELLGNGAVTFVPADCPTSAPPSYDLSARVVDTNTIESIAARWFVNYDFRDLNHNRIWYGETIQPNPDTTNLTRVIKTFKFLPYEAPPPYGTTPPLPGSPWPQAGIVRVVELVVSNGFDHSLDDTIAPGANRAPLPGFETQYHRWVYVTSSTVPCP